MKSSYGKEPKDETAWLKAAQAERQGKGIRLRVQPVIFRTSGSRQGQGQYKAWPDVSWTIDCDSVEEVLALREALRAFFVAVTLEGPGPLEQRLRKGPTTNKKSKNEEEAA